MESVYRIEADRIVVSPFASGPWSPDMQHGGGPSSLFAHAAATTPAPAPMRLARLTVDLMRPVPVADMQLETTLLREGRKIQLLGLSLKSGGVEVTRGTALRVRIDDGDGRAPAAESPMNLPLPEAGKAPPPSFGRGVGFVSGMSFSVVRGALREPGPAAIWCRNDRTLIEGQENLPAMRAAACSDFCNGFSSVLSFEDWTFINADVTVSLARDPVGEWVLVDAEMTLGPGGGGLATARLGDRQGWFGRAVQSVIAEPRQ